MVKKISKKISKGITKDMLITDIINKYPDKYFEIAQAMGDAGIHCIGCQVAAFETLEQGMALHGFTKKDIDSLIKKLNKIVTSKKKSS